MAFHPQRHRKRIRSYSRTETIERKELSRTQCPVCGIECKYEAKAQACCQPGLVEYHGNLANAYSNKRRGTIKHDYAPIDGKEVRFLILEKGMGVGTIVKSTNFAPKDVKMVMRQVRKELGTDKMTPEAWGLYLRKIRREKCGTKWW